MLKFAILDICKSFWEMKNDFFKILKFDKFLKKKSLHDNIFSKIKINRKKILCRKDILVFS